ncbi:hypothetical protein TL16_g06184 [Triparma laevis f. inornata]|uniref:UBX domain-containing protein n=2 Tax=Triparma laevis TaxID=1534972 RepID=A0A9W7AJJ9_9STRA|nr:hypothetical protein TL16_g06184 [Triparma laevis f. inornata]
MDLCSPTSEQPKAKRREKPKPKPAKPKLPQRARPPAQPRPTFVDEEKQMQSAISQSNKIVKDGQDSEYFESLKKDKAKEQQKREEELQKEEEKLIENTVEESAKSLEVEVRSKLERMKEVLKHKIPPVDAEDTDDTIITLLIKLPRSFASTSVTRKFYKANLAEDVLEFIRADEKEKKEGGELHLCTVFPVRKVGEEETIESLGLGKRGTVVVREPSAFASLSSAFASLSSASARFTISSNTIFSSLAFTHNPHLSSFTSSKPVRSTVMPGFVGWMLTPEFHKHLLTLVEDGEMIFHRGVDIAFDFDNSSDEERQEFINMGLKRNELVTQVIFLQKLPRVGDWACYLATSLVIVDIPEGVESIGREAF